MRLKHNALVKHVDEYRQMRFSDSVYDAISLYGQPMSVISIYMNKKY